MPIITAIEECIKDKARVNIYLEGHFNCAIDKTVALELKLHRGMDISADTLNMARRKDDMQKALSRALERISRGSMTERGLMQFLSRKGYGEEACEYAIHRIKEYGYINDRVYAESHTQTGVSKNLGKKLIEQKLIQKGIERDMAKEAVSTIDDDSQLQSAIILAKKYFNAIKEEDPRKKRYKTSQRLYMKGFDWDTIKMAVAKVEGGDEEFSDEG